MAYSLKNKIALMIAFAVALQSCGALPTAENSSGTFLGATPVAAATDLTGYVIVAESTTRRVMLFDTRLNYVRDLWTGPTGVAQTPIAVAMYDINTAMIMIDSNDQILTQNIAAPSRLGQVLISDATNLVIGATRESMTRLDSGDILISETGNFIERFTSLGVRVATGWPLASLTAPSGMDKISTGAASGGFIHCATTANQVRSHNSVGTTLNTAVTVAAHQFLDCVAHTDGRIAVALNGATDRVRIYTDYTFASSCDYSSATLMPNPRTLDFTPTGNVLVFDNTTKLLLEIDSSCALVTTYTSNYLTPATVTDMVVVQ